MLMTVDNCSTTLSSTRLLSGPRASLRMLLTRYYSLLKIHTPMHDACLSNANCQACSHGLLLCKAPVYIAACTKLAIKFKSVMLGI